METHIQAVDDVLIDSLSFKLPSSANFINDRRSVSFFPSGGNVYAPTGVKIIKFMLSGSDWLDPSSVRINFRLSNGYADRTLHLINPLPSNFFRRLRIIAGGQVIEDIDSYNRVYNMIHTLLPAERRLNDYAEGFGLNSSYGVPGGAMQFANIAFDAGHEPPVILPDGSRVVQFSLLCGLFNQPKFLPLKYMQGLQIELEVVNDYNEVLCYGGEIAGASQLWVITEPQIKCDVMNLDNTLDNEYAKYLLEGKSLPINFSSYVHQMQAVGATPQPTIAMTRAFTRLKTVYVSFYKTPVVWRVNGATPEATARPATWLPLKECNFFWHPQYLDFGRSINFGNEVPEIRENGNYTFMGKTEVEAQLQIGSKLFPEMPMRSSAEQYYHLRKSLGSHRPGSAYAINILDREYRSFKYILAFDCEKMGGSGFTGYNTRSGDLITVKLRNLQHVQNDGTILDNTFADMMHTTLEYDAIMTISDTGVQVME